MFTEIIMYSLCGHQVIVFNVVNNDILMNTIKTQLEMNVLL
jgi:hypothetical protein